MLETIMNMHVLLYAMVSLGALGAIAMLATNLTYRRFIKSTRTLHSLKEKYLSFWLGRDKLLARMNRLVWYPSLGSTALLILALYLVTKGEFQEGLSLTYLYVGTMIPVALMAARVGFDFSYREEILVNALSDYLEAYLGENGKVTEVQRKDPVLQEEVVEQITASIRQTAATGSHFSRMLSQEEEEIMREIIREFMN